MITIQPSPKLLPWTLPGETPEPGWGFLEHPLPPDLAAALVARAAAEGTTTLELLCIVHARVMHLLTGEREHVIAVEGQPRLITVEDGSWRDLLTAVRRAPMVDAPGAETAVGWEDDPYAVGGVESGDVLALTLRDTADPMGLVLSHRRSVVDTARAARIAGYLERGLALACQDLDAPHRQGSLLPEAERTRLIEELGGHRVAFDGRYFRDHFEAQVDLRGRDLAAAHGSNRWTYAQLNARANQIASTLLSSGLRAEDPVAVVMERNLDWIAATIGVLKAGGCYLPVRPDFPPERIATQLERSECTFAITETGSDAVLDAALALTGRACTVLRPDALPASASERNPHVAFTPDHLAYIYFTSGSTGTPKGAMCEHGGMVNHLHMKIEDLGLRAGDVVTQTASQCFDISLWQVLAPLMIGGSTRIVDTARQLDVPAFLAELGAGGINAIQVVPSYLEVMTGHLEQSAADLGELRIVSVTGEALKHQLVRRWFEVCPGVPLVNAYGATEVSDDTMHEILTEVPVRDFVSVGPSRRNVSTYVLDEHQDLVPEGSPGEIAFAGICVGRGYINDPARTEEAFQEDPHQPGERLYRTGDYGRWLPEGRMEFLGRRDEQVKIRGYRIEIGEIENRLLRMPGVSEAAVVVKESGEERHLVAFWSGTEDLVATDLRDFVAASVPDYMVPSRFQRLESLPLTENGKTDKRRLGAMASVESLPSTRFEPPLTQTEQRLATAWAETLDSSAGQIGRHDSFYDVGGTSLAAVRLIVKLQQQISLRDLAAHPVLSDLAVLIDARTADAGATTTRVPLLQDLTPRGVTPRARVVCFPYAGGNAVNFQRFAATCGDHGIGVLAVELPGHDIARAEEAREDVEEIARLVADELADWRGMPCAVWGHGSGIAPALALTKLLDAKGQPPAAVVVASQPLLTDDELLALERASAAEPEQAIIERLHASAAYIELDGLRSERATLVAQAYRHDMVIAATFLRELQERGTIQVASPLHVVYAADDPGCTGAGGPLGWDRVVDVTQVHRLTTGGHRFIGTQPDQAAVIVSALL